jgi:hypothetical protein
MGYPTSKTIDGDTFDVGWDDVRGSRDTNRDAGVDGRLAGMCDCRAADATAWTFRIDLPSAGNYYIGLAVGDASFGNNQLLDVLDDSSVLFSISPETATSAGEFIDATETIRTSASDWVTNNTEALLTFSTTICNVRLNKPATNATTIAHFSIRAASGGGSSIAAISNYYRMMRSS